MADDPIPRYAQCDIWMAIYGNDSSSDYEAYRTEHGFADTWAFLCAQVRIMSEPNWEYRVFCSDPLDWMSGAYGYGYFGVSFQSEGFGYTPERVQEILDAHPGRRLEHKRPGGFYWETITVEEQKKDKPWTYKT